MVGSEYSVVGAIRQSSRERLSMHGLSLRETAPSCVPHQSHAASTLLRGSGLWGGGAGASGKSVRVPTFDTRPNYQLMCALNITVGIVLR